MRLRHGQVYAFALSFIAGLASLVGPPAGSEARGEVDTEAVDGVGVVVESGASLESIVVDIRRNYGAEVTKDLLMGVSAREAEGTDTGFPGIEGPADSAAAAGLARQLDDATAAGTRATAVGAYPVIGAAIADGYAWRMTSVSEYVYCALGVFACTVTDRRTTRFVVDPGVTADRVTIHHTYFPNDGKLQNPRITLKTYRNSTVAGTLVMTVTTAMQGTVFTIGHASYKSNGFTFTIGGTILTAAGTRALSTARTGWGACSSAATPICRY